MEKFGLRLENLREKFGFTKKEVSIKLGFTPNVYGAYERGDRRPTLETLIKLSDIYEVSLDYLITGKEYQRHDTCTQNEMILQNVIAYFEDQGISDPYILELNKWELLSREDLEELRSHFEWIVEKAKRAK